MVNRVGSGGGMSLFNALVRSVNDQFGLGTQSAPLVREVLRLITEGAAGIGGFLDRFRNVGLGSAVSSWVGKSDNQPLTTAQLQNALGSDTLDRVARKVGLSASAAAPAIAFLIPKLVDALTPDGYVPNTLSPDARAFLTGSATGGASPRGPVPEHRRRGIGSWLWGLLALLILGLLGYWFLGRPSEHQVATAPTQTAPTPMPAPAPAVAPAPVQPAPTPVQPAPTTPPRLAVSNATDGSVHYDGVVGDEETRSGIVGALQRVFGADKVSGSLNVDPTVAPAGWFQKLEAALANLKIPGVEAIFHGNRIDIGGAIPQADIERLKQTMQKIFGNDITVASFADELKAMFGEAKAKSLAALDSLQPGFTSADLVDAMNLAIINFETGSATISAESRDILERAAATMKQAPQGTHIEIGGHTDSTGDPAANMALSQHRADAVRQALIEYGVSADMLTAKGYGDSQPVASNATPEGRLKNRRIAFVVVQ
jgi:OOP family OmpA-OmpF porin